MCAAHFARCLCMHLNTSPNTEYHYYITTHLLLLLFITRKCYSANIRISHLLQTYRRRLRRLVTRVHGMQCGCRHRRQLPCSKSDGTRCRNTQTYEEKNLNTVIGMRQEKKGVRVSESRMVAERKAKIQFDHNGVTFTCFALESEWKKRGEEKEAFNENG